MSLISIKGVERALPGEKILINIAVHDENVVKIRVSLSKLLSLRRALNYDVDMTLLSKKELDFYVSEFILKNNLALDLASEKPEKVNEEALVKVTAFNEQQEVIDVVEYSIIILRPLVEFTMTHGKEKGRLKIKLEQREPLITTFFEGFIITARDLESNAHIEVEIKRFSISEYITHLDEIPLIFDIDHAIKEILIFSDHPIILQVRVLYSDICKNQYESNVSEIELDPATGFEYVPEKGMFKTNFHAFNVIGLEAPVLSEM